MSGILADPVVPESASLGARLGRLDSPLKRFFDTVPEIKACAFIIVSPAASERDRRGSPAGVTWSDYFPWDKETMPALEAEDRFPASAWRLQNAQEALTISSFLLTLFPSSAGSAAGLLALRSGLYWVHDIGILSLQTPALGSYPKNPIIPVFPAEPTGHEMMAAEPNFAAAFPQVEEAIVSAWGRDF